MKILAIASEAFELKPWTKRCDSFEKLRWPLSYAGKSCWNGHELHTAANGPGPRLASQALQTGLQLAGPFEVIMSIGLCGALHPEYRLNQICTATSISDGHRSWPAEPLADTTRVKLLSFDRFLAEPAEKQTFHRQGLDIIEMEAAPLARYAQENNVPFHAVKVVSDEAHERFQLDFNHYRDAAGRFDRTKIALAAVSHPFRFAPDLFRLATRGPAASEILGVFLAHARL